ncbi:PTS sugar transporter subunit IIA [uncultured Dubosiella sp.]|uniref:PTS sugar transporter subunit IIA n=1 Tax=uncultured Dubosiella sp. TaxID=1937011 RepID=UPI0025B5F48D|nr:hypothetical protein [uncultured Dubosiella sp.]
MRKIVIASHDEFARGLKNSVEMIVGDLAKEIDTYCLYPSCSPRDYTDQMEAVIASHPEDEFIFLCDVKGGSVHTAVSQLSQYEYRAGSALVNARKDLCKSGNSRAAGSRRPGRVVRNELSKDPKAMRRGRFLKGGTKNYD